MLDRDIHLPENTQKLIDLSDEIAAINMRMLERSRNGRADDAADRDRLAFLMDELQETKPHSRTVLAD